MVFLVETTNLKTGHRHSMAMSMSMTLWCANGVRGAMSAKDYMTRIDVSPLIVSSRGGTRTRTGHFTGIGPPLDFKSSLIALNLGSVCVGTTLLSGTCIDSNVQLQFYLNWVCVSNPATDLPLIYGSVEAIRIWQVAIA